MSVSINTYHLNSVQVAVGLIQAKATRVLWPPNRWGKIASDLPKGRGPLATSEIKQLHEELQEDDSKLHKRTDAMKLAEKDNHLQKDKDHLSEYAFLPEKVGPHI